jgi:hypothetical protein
MDLCEPELPGPYPYPLVSDVGWLIVDGFDTFLCRILEPGRAYLTFLKPVAVGLATKEEWLSSTMNNFMKYISFILHIYTDNLIFN